VVGRVGTDLHTRFFDPQTAGRLHDIVSPLGSLIKGHYTDWVDAPSRYPESGMGAANVGPEMTAAEYQALAFLGQKERALCVSRPRVKPSGMMETLEEAVVRSMRWTKWLQSDERGVTFRELPVARRAWLTQTGARYIWTDPQVSQARRKLYANLARVGCDANEFVVERVSGAIENYINAFNLFDSVTLLGA
jgi:tagatose-1,6-bisphosphate aldolase non-catalytic subunit AgaZ/GatZ